MCYQYETCDMLSWNMLILHEYLACLKSNMWKGHSFHKMLVQKMCKEFCCACCVFVESIFVSNSKGRVCHKRQSSFWHSLGSCLSHDPSLLYIYIHATFRAAILIVIVKSCILIVQCHSHPCIKFSLSCFHLVHIAWWEVRISKTRRRKVTLGTAHVGLIYLR